MEQFKQKEVNEDTLVCLHCRSDEFHKIAPVKFEDWPEVGPVEILIKQDESQFVCDGCHRELDWDELVRQAG